MTTPETLAIVLLMQLEEYGIDLGDQEKRKNVLAAIRKVMDNAYDYAYDKGYRDAKETWKHR